MASMSDLNLADQLYHYMVGGHKRQLVSIIYIYISVGVTSLYPCEQIFWQYLNLRP